MEYGVPYYEKYMPYILETVDGQVCSLSLTLSLSLSLSLSPDRTRAIHSAGVVSFHVNVSVLM